MKKQESELEKMEYVLLFLEGIATFISPCILPMLPIYILYLTGQGDKDNKKLLLNSIGFFIGFAILFSILGAVFAGIGKYLSDYSNIINIVFGIIIILFGLNFIDVIKIPFINKTKKVEVKTNKKGFFQSILFGMVFGLGWTPCLGALLGSALMMVANTGNILQGITMLLVFSLGLGVPFILSAVLIEQLKNTFNFIKKNYKTINIISAALLIIIGLYMLVQGILKTI